MTSTQQVYGPRKVWKQLRREASAWRAAPWRASCARWASPSLSGVGPGSPRPTPVRAAAPWDLVDRQFVATRPNQLWVSDFSYVATWGGFVYVAFVIDVFARALWAGGGCRPPCARTSCSDALEQAIYARRGDALTGLVHHSDAGSQGEFNWSSQHLDDEVLQCRDGKPEKVRPGGSACDAFAWSAAGNGGVRAATVLEGDRAGAVE